MWCNVKHNSVKTEHFKKVKSRSSCKWKTHILNILFNSLMNEGVTIKKPQLVQRELKEHTYIGCQRCWNKFTKADTKWLLYTEEKINETPLDRNHFYFNRQESFALLSIFYSV